jgi:hypothetical protein
MKVVITINCSGPAFEGENLGPELARILIGLAGRLYNTHEGCRFYPGSIPLFDINGKKVGKLLAAPRPNGRPR